MSSLEEIKVHPLTKDPTAAWNALKKHQVVMKVDALPLDMPVSPRALRFVCVSDTHSLISRMTVPIPPGDVFVHAGDFTRFGLRKEVQDFNKFLGTLPHRHKIVIAGNHELSFDSSKVDIRTDIFSRATNQIPVHVESRSTSQVVSPEKDMCELLTNCKYLQDSTIELCGIKIYGTPWQPEFCNWAFNLPRGEACLDKWRKIPLDTDVLITHSPPVGHGDLCVSGLRAGCVELLQVVQKCIKPKYHIFGHIHEGYGITTDGKTIFINASTCNISYLPRNAPIIFDIPLPKGYTKE